MLFLILAIVVYLENAALALLIPANLRLAEVLPAMHTLMPVIHNLWAFLAFLPALFSLLLFPSENFLIEEEPDYRFLGAHIASLVPIGLYFFLFHTLSLDPQHPARLALCGILHIPSSNFPLQPSLTLAAILIALSSYLLFRTFFPAGFGRGYALTAFIALVIAKFHKLFLFPALIWQSTCGIVGQSVYGVLWLTGFNAQLTWDTGPRSSFPIVGTDAFSVGVYTPCSGVEGFTSFLIVFALLVILNWRKIRIARAAFAFVAGLVAMFVANVARIYILILIGHFIGSNVAVHLWHSYGSLIFYALVIIALMSLIQKWITEPRE